MLIPCEKPRPASRRRASAYAGPAGDFAITEATDFFSAAGAGGFSFCDHRPAADQPASVATTPVRKAANVVIMEEAFMLFDRRFDPLHLLRRISKTLDGRRWRGSKRRSNN